VSQFLRSNPENKFPEKSSFRRKVYSFIKYKKFF
jgi:hypothetical protein